MVETTSSDVLTIATLEGLRAVSDPLRLRIVSVLAQQPRTAKELAGELGVAQGKLYYHLDLLERQGFIAVESTRLVSGIVEKRYRAVARDLRVDRKLLAANFPEETVDSLFTAVLDATRLEAERSVRAGALSIAEDPPSPRAGLFARVQVRLTEAEAQALRAELDAILARLKSHEPSGDNHDVRLYDFTVAHFRVAEGD